MFSTTPYFKNVECPRIRKGEECKLVNCIFSHEVSVEPVRKKRKGSEESDSIEDDTGDGEEGKIDEQEEKINEQEKIGIQEGQDESDDQEVPNIRNDCALLIPRPYDYLDVPLDDRQKALREIYDVKHLTADAIVAEFEACKASLSVDDYKVNIKRTIEGRAPLLRTDPQYIVPKELAGSPESLPTRKKYIEHMANAYKKHGEISYPVLRAIEEEFVLAKSNSKATYSQSVRRKVHQITHPEKYKRSQSVVTDELLWKALQETIIPRAKLQKFGYVVETPSITELPQQRVCHRCGAEFLRGQQMNVVTCRFHPGRLRRKDKNTRVYDCCKLPADGSDPCTTYLHHVFYWDNSDQRHTAINYKRVEHVDKRASRALGIDCEMGYTTLGFELLRATAVDFFTGKDVFDVMVKPIGEVVDLNTRYSGVLGIPADSMTFEEARGFFGRYIDKNTVLIGHGLENDLNAMRMLHDRVVDTAVLYPKYKATPTFRFSLKDLAFSYLSRNIQMGEHDSREDSIAAIDVVKYHLRKN